MPPFVKFWGHVLLPAATAKLLGLKTGSAAARPAFTPDYGAVWSDYPAFALTQPPVGPAAPAHVAYLDGTVYNNPKKYANGNGGGGLWKPKKDTVPGPPIPVATGKPVFDIVVEPEYVPDPFPVPYPYPIEDDYTDNLYISTRYGGSENADHEDDSESADNANTTRRRKPKYKKTSYIERSDPQWACPKDYMEEGQKCVTFDVLDVEIGCVDGWDYRNAECFAIDIQLPELVCPEGFEQVGIHCERKTVAPKQMMCPENQFQTVQGCKQKVVSDAAPQCVGAVLQNGQCHRTKRLRPDPRCQEGFGLGADHRTCFRDSVAAGFQSCPHGFVLDGNNSHCEKVLQADASISCPFSYELDGLTCYRKVAQPILKTCPFGLLSESGTCVSTKSIGKPTLSCVHGAIMNAHMKCELTLKTMANTHKKKKEPCESGHKFIGEECIKIITTDPIKSCDVPDSKLIDHECIVNLSTPPMISCPPGQSLQGDVCYSTEATTVESSCPVGFDLTLDGHCARKETALAQLACPAGFKAGADGMCHQVEKIDAVLVCPASTELRMDSESGFKEYICHGMETLEPSYTCLVPGLELETTAEGIKCTGWQLNEPEFVCATGFTDDGGRCIKLESGVKLPVCPADYTFSFDSCIKELRQPALYFCPDGYTHQKKSRTCSRKKFTDLMAICPPDMEFDALVGECYKMKTDVSFDEKEMEPTKPAEALKDLDVPTPAATTVATPASAASGPGNWPWPFPMPYTEPNVVPAVLPAPQLTIVQQPVVVPQPAVILPQQAPVPPPPAIRVPYGVPQPVPTAVRPLEHHQHHMQQITNNSIQHLGTPGGYYKH